LRRQQRNMPAQHFLLLLFPTIPMMMWRFWTEDLDVCHPCPVALLILAFCLFSHTFFTKLAL
jgi:hypothetical protein